MTGRRVLKSILASTLVLSLVLAASAGTAPAHAASLDDLRRQQSSLQQQGTQLDSQLQKLKNDKARQLQYEEALEAKGENLERQIDSKNKQIWDLDSDIFEKQKIIAGKQKDIKADYEKLKGRVRALYEAGEASDLEIILNAKNIMDLADKAEILRVVSEHDTALINTLKSDLNSVKAEKAAIERNRKSVSDAKDSLEKNRQQLSALAGEAAKTVAALDQNQQGVESARADNKEALQTADASIREWLSSYYASRESSTVGSSSGSVSGKSSGGTQESSGSAPAGSSATKSRVSPDRGSGGGTAGSTGSSRENPVVPSVRSGSGRSSGGSASKMVSVAGKYIGSKYEWGAEGPDTFDCSGFVSYVAARSGWSFGRADVGGLHALCSPVSTPQAGDLIFYSDYDHVGIYVGGGRAIQCDGDQTHSEPGVETVSLSGYWNSRIDSYGRLP